MLRQRLQIAEYVFLLASVVGWAIAVSSKQLIYAAVPVTLALLVNLLNRLRLEQQMNTLKGHRNSVRSRFRANASKFI
jgi:hypothetical protein